MRFSGKKTFITGASRGIGLAIARAFRSEGAWVIGTRTSDHGVEDDVCQEWVTADFLNVEHIVACAERVRLVEPVILINSAGINRIAPFLDVTAEDFLSIQQVNLYAPFRLCQAAIPAMKRNRWGRIVNISSIWGKVGKEHRASYSSSKFALDGMTLALAAEHSEHGIVANSIAPGFIDTELTRRVLGDQGIQTLISQVPTRRLGGVEEVARFVLWLASDENTYITGQNIAIDGGFTRV